jgi:hypothetical protein
MKGEIYSLKEYIAISMSFEKLLNEWNELNENYIVIDSEWKDSNGAGWGENWSERYDDCGWDERYDLEKSTIAACQYLKNKKAIFNDWPLACAAYNSGETGVKNRMKDQGCDNYWDLYTNTETSRYVYRIIAYKLIMENPQQYGYYFRKKDTYLAIPTQELIIDSSINDLYAFAKHVNVPYKYLRNLNPAIRGSKIVNKNNKKLKLFIPSSNSLSWENLTKDLKHESIQIGCEGEEI